MKFNFSRFNGIVFTVITVGAFILAGVIAAPFLLKATTISDSIRGQFLFSIILYSLMVIPAWFIGLSKRDRRAVLTNSPSRNKGNPLFVIIPFFLAIPFNAIYVTIIEKLLPSLYKAMEEAGNLAANMPQSQNFMDLFLLFLTLVVMAPIFEEMVFRGIFYNLLNKKQSLLVAALISSLFFGLLHGATFFQTAVLGFVLAMIYQVTGKLWMAMAAHAFNNFIGFLQVVLMSYGVLKVGPDGTPLPESLTAFSVMSGFILVGIVLSLIALILYLKKNPPRAIFKDVAPVFKQGIKEIPGEEY